MTNIILNLYLLSKLSREVINIKEMKDFSEIYSNFLNEESSITLIHSFMIIEKTKDLRKYINSINFLAKSKVKLPCIIWISYQKTLSNKS